MQWTYLPSMTIGGQQVVTASRSELTEALISDCHAFRRNDRPFGPRLVFDINGHGLSLSKTDASYRSALASADIIHADGGFLVTLSKRLNPTPITERSATTDLIHDFALRAREEGIRFFLLGGSEAVNAACARNLEEIYPGLSIAGRHHGYFSHEDADAVIDLINHSGADVVFVGLGKPNEQLFSVKNAHRIRSGWLVTCGGCFNYVAGEYDRAPEWMQRNNIEWLHRMATKPKQFFWRYLTTTPHALWIVATEAMKQRREQKT
ncbi:WecB/TagA/CpsF family glycosyltransferase [Pelagibacterium nitratireducens]|uniref:WecB/TagA/CpsF family glycosyltransferase n=1 Tax=Pelagibacterium nitratireducens TaxID=1046114 RepID=A0ABZ2I531_9HYPH